MLLKVLLTIVSACFAAEFIGYFVHKLLHSHKIESLSRAHMIHHLLIYGPNMHQRPKPEYIYSTSGRFSIGQIGIEWVAPITILMGSILLGFWALKIPMLYQGIFVLVSLSWGIFMFSYVHDTLHMKGIWLEKAPFLHRQFLRARKLHDIHHMELADNGLMTKNFGICFFFFDKIFGTLSTAARPFNKRGFEEAQKLYAYINYKEH